MSPASVLVTGANRGIGLGLVKEFLKNNQIKNLIATCRDPQSAVELKKLSDPRLSVLKMEVTNDKSIEDAFGQIDKIVGSKGLNLLVNNAGVLLNYKTDQKPDRAVVQQQLDVNTTSVLIVTQTFLPLLKRAAATNSTDELSVNSSAIVNISSDLGSIANNTVGSTPKGFLAYRISKAGVNAMAKTLAIDLAPEKILVASFHPGWVQTDMGGEIAPVSIDDSASNLVNSMYKLKKEHSGYLFTRDLQQMPF